MSQGECEGPRVGGAGAVHELGRDWETSARGKVGKGRRTRTRAKGGWRYLWSSGKQRGLGAHALPDRGPLNPGGRNTTI